MIKFKKTEKIVVTSALPYVNGVKHLGNIIGSILPADIFHRFLDLMEIKNIFICGTDDHGSATEISAFQEKMDTKEYVEKFHNLQKKIYEQWDFDFTNFGRTSSKIHHELTNEVFFDIHKNGFILERTLKLPYCNNCKRFLPDRYIFGTCPKCGYENARGDQCEKCATLLDPIQLKNARCSICNLSNIKFEDQKNLFIDLARLQPELKKWIESNKHWPETTKSIAMGWIKEGLKPRCITRSIKWGIKVPLKGYEHLSWYVWFDAPIGYISITKEKLKDWKKWWTQGKIYHFLAKDNIPFHTVFWPATLIAQGRKYSLPYYVSGYEYLNWECQKFSTSKGIGLFSDEALALFPSDYWRFYLSRILPETKDSNFDWKDFQARINNELIANYGNLFYRVTSFIVKNFEKVPKPGKIGKEEKVLEKKLVDAIKNVEKHIEDVKLKDALMEILSLSSEVNKYFQDKKPWETQDKTALYYSVNIIYALSVLLSPFVPKSTEKALNLLNAKKISLKKLSKFQLKAGHKIKSEILFKKIEDEEMEKAIKYKTKYAKTEFQEKGIEVAMPELRVATINKVEDHPNAEKLYVLNIDLGNETRQIVAGLKSFYRKDQLQDKQIVVISNMKPAVLRGVKSSGMMLACDNGTFLTTEKHLENGTTIRKSEGEVTLEDLSKIDLRVKNVGEKLTATINGEPMQVNNIKIVPEKAVPEGMKIR